MPAKINYPAEHLSAAFPYLIELPVIAQEIVNTLYDKEANYQGSWKKRGGVGAFMMLARKWDRIEAISNAEKYDILKALEEEIGDVGDDVEDLIAYLLLCLAVTRMNKREKFNTSIEKEAFDARNSSTS